jgi:hypothetical protein
VVDIYPNPIILQFKNTNLIEILNWLDSFLGYGFKKYCSLDECDRIKLIATKDSKVRNKYLIKEVQYLKNMRTQVNIDLGYVQLWEIKCQQSLICEVQIYKNGDIPTNSRGKHVCLPLAVDLCEEFILVDPSKKVRIPELDLEWPRKEPSIIPMVSMVPDHLVNGDELKNSNELFQLDLNETEPIGRVKKYGINRDMTGDEVRELVKACKYYQKNEGTVEWFYNDKLPPYIKDKFSLETFKKWLKDPRFKPQEEE